MLTRWTSIATAKALVDSVSPELLVGVNHLIVESGHAVAGQSHLVFFWVLDPPRGLLRI